MPSEYDVFGDLTTDFAQTAVEQITTAVSTHVAPIEKQADTLSAAIQNYLYGELETPTASTILLENVIRDAVNRGVLAADDIKAGLLSKALAGVNDSTKAIAAETGDYTSLIAVYIAGLTEPIVKTADDSQAKADAAAAAAVAAAAAAATAAEAARAAEAEKSLGIFAPIGAALAPIQMLGELRRLFDLIKTSIDTLSEVGRFTASPDLAEDIKTKVGALSNIGAILGAPMGFLPLIGDVYSAGLGELIKNEARLQMQPTRLSLQDYILARKRKIITVDYWRTGGKDLGYPQEEVDIARALTRQLLAATDFTTLWRRGELTDNELADKLSELTIDDDDIEHLKKLTRYMLSINDLISLWLRGELSEPELDIRLAELGVKGLDAEYLKSLAYFIPGVPDLIHMAVREAFTPEIAEKFGQYQDFPPALAEYGAKQGLSAEWAQRYWAAHWELPSIQMAFEMFQRKVIDRNELDLLLRALDVMPYWRDKLTQIAYQPITRVDIRRMHKLKILSDEDIQLRYEAIGYSPEDAHGLVLFTIELNKEEEKYEKQAERDLTASEILSAYASVLIDEGNARALLAELGFDGAEIDLKLSLAALPGIKRIRTKQIDIIKQRLAYGVIDLNGAVDALNKLDLPAFEMEYQLLDIQMDMELAEIKVEAAAVKAAAAREAAAAKAAAAAEAKRAK